MHRFGFALDSFVFVVRTEYIHKILAIFVIVRMLALNVMRISECAQNKTCRSKRI